jgi:hypothetical protein
MPPNRSITCAKRPIDLAVFKVIIAADSVRSLQFTRRRKMEGDSAPIQGSSTSHGLLRAHGMSSLPPRCWRSRTALSGSVAKSATARDEP